MKTMTGLNYKVNSNIALSGYNSDKQLADELNNFHLRFNCMDFSETHDILRSNTRAPPDFVTDIKSVEKYFRHTKPSKSPGPDNIGGKVLATCAEQLSSIFHFILSLSLQQQKVPNLWKHATIVPVAKTKPSNVK